MKYVYILQSLNDPEQRYVGVTSDLNQRLTRHNSGRCPYTSKFIPWELVYSEQFKEELEAFARERQIKKWSKAKKEALISGNLKNLKVLSKRRKY
jgi:putative endonuclease